MTRYGLHIGRAVFFDSPWISARALPALLAALVLAGFLWCVARRRTVVEWYMASYKAVLLLYPAERPQRYLAPVVPFLWYYLLIALGRGCGLVLRALPRPTPALVAPARACAVALLALILASNAFEASRPEVTNPDGGRRSRDEAYAAVMPCVERHTPEHGVCLWAAPALRFLRSGRQSAPVGRSTGGPSTRGSNGRFSWATGMVEATLAAFGAGARSGSRRHSPLI